MRGFNRVILAGNLTRDPQLSYTPSNTAICELRMAMNRKWADRDGNMKEEVCYVDITAYAKQAETINQYMRKGQPMLVEGRLRFRQWTDKEGKNRNRLDVVAENFTFLGGPGGGERGGAPPAQQAAGRPAPAPAAVPEDAPPPDDGPPPEDIPF